MTKTKTKPPCPDTNLLKQQKKEHKKKEKALLEKEIAHNSKKFKLADFFVHRPFTTLLINFAIFILASALSLGLGAFDMAENSDREYLIWDDIRVQDFDMQKLMEEQFQEDQSADQELPVRSQEEIDWNTNIILKCNDCDNILTSEGIKHIVQIEKDIKDLDKYENVCLASLSSTYCASNAIYTINTIIDAKGLDYQNLSDSDVEDIIDVILANFDTYKFLFSNDFDENNRKATYMRFIMNFGVPLKVNGHTYKNKFDEEEKQEEYFDDFSQDVLDYQEKYEKKLPGKYGLYMYSNRIDALLFKQIVDSDSMWAIASVLFVYAYLTFHVKSFIISTFSIISILVSFPITQVIYSLIFQISYFSSLHIMAVFVILGIAADDLFVLVDAWNQTAFYDQIKDDLTKRMALTFRRAAYAMLATSSTTSAAFFATGLSDIMPISAFGIYAGILVPINYILTIFFMPCILVINERVKCCKRKQKKEENQQELQKYQKQQEFQTNEQKTGQQNYIAKQTSTQEVIQRVESEKEQNQVSSNQVIIDPLQKQQEKQYQDIDDDQKSDIEDVPEQKLPPVEKFFAHYFNNFIRKIKFIVILVIIVWLAISVWQATKISPLTEPEQFLPDDHQVEISKKLLLEGFHASSISNSGIKIYYFWGVQGINKEGVSMWDPENLGKIEWDKNFDLSSKNNQQWFYDYCDELQNNELVQDGLVESFIFGFKDYADANAGGFPVDQEDFMDVLKNYVENDLDGQYHFNLNRIGLIDDKLQYVQIKIAAKGVPFRPYKETYPLWKKWNNLVENGNDDAPKGLKKAKFTAQYHFSWMISEKAFSDNALQGMLISILFAFVVLLFSTKNIIITIYSIFSIVGIVLSCVCIMQFSEWELGVAESIALVVLIGMSVDYVVHLANHYVESIYTDRHNKIMVSLRDLGISIISSAVTTIGSGVFLIFAQLVIFNKFAILVICTILFSLLFSLFFFSSLCHIIGPQNDFGNVMVLFKKCKKNKQLTVSNNEKDHNSGNKSQNSDNQQHVQKGIVDEQVKQFQQNENNINMQKSGEVAINDIDEEAIGNKIPGIYQSNHVRKN